MLTGVSTITVQAQTLNFSFKNAPLDKVINEIAKKSGYEFIFDAAYTKNARPTNLDIKSATIDEALTLVFKQQNFSYEISGKVIVLKPKNISKASNGTSYLIKGKVTDSTGVSLPGVTVRVKEESTNTQTDGDGLFSIQVTEQHHTLVFDYLGYKQIEINAVNSYATGQIKIILPQNASLLKEVLITGYQSILKERSPASFSLVDSATLNRQLNTDLLSSLEGRVAGILYNKNPNGLGADKPVLRGIATYSTSVGTSPLIVIDGLPTETPLEEINPYDVESVTVLKDAAAASVYGARAANGIILITTKKGKGNGVQVNLNVDLFVTGKPDLDKMHYATTSDMIDFETDVYNRERSRFATTQTMFDSYGNIGKNTIKYYSPLYELYRKQSSGLLSTDQVNNTLSQWRQNDYIKDYEENVWQNEVRKRYNLSLSSAAAKSNSYLSLNYDESNDRIKYNKNQNFNLYAKSSFKIKKWLNATVGLNGTYATADATNSDYNNYLLQPRYAQITDGNGNLVQSEYANVKDGFTSGGEMNPAVVATLQANGNFKPINFNILDAMQEGVSKNKSLNLRAFADLKADIYKGLSYSSQIQYEVRRNDSESYYDANSYKMRYAYNTLTSYNSTTTKYLRNLPEGGRYAQFNQQTNNYTFRNQFNYTNTFGSKENEHAISAIAGFEMRQTYSPRTLEQLRYGYDPITLGSTILDNATLRAGITSFVYGNTKTLGSISPTQQEIKNRYLSAYSTLNYTFRNKYNLSGSVRVDQTNLFGIEEKNKRRPLWSVGAGWNANYEDFLKDIQWLNTLKLRATYGIGGNVDQSSYPILTIRYRNDGLFPSLQYSDILSLPNPKLRWEKTATTNLGLDYSMFQNRLRGSIDFYNRYSTDLLTTTDLDPTVGALTRRINSGALRNRGVEISIGGEWLKKDDLTFSSNFIFAYNKNTVKLVNRAASTAGSYVGSPLDYFFLDQQYNSLYAYKYGGMTNGYPYFLDQNGQSNVTFDANGVPTAVKSINSPDALVNMGSLTPLYNGSFSQRIQYKNFELGALFVFSGGNKLRKDVSNLYNNAVTDEEITQRWKAGNTPNLPRLYVDYDESALNYATTLSDFWKNSDNQILDASYIKLRNVSLSYNLSNRISKLINVNAIRLTAQVNNLWYWSAAGDDIDPETYSLNGGSRSTPLAKSFLLGLNVNF